MENGERILRLAKPKRKGWLNIIFSRFFIIVLLIAAQVFLVAWFLTWARRYLPHYAAVQILFIAVMILVLFNGRGDASSKLTWMWLIALFPVAGAGFLLFTQTNLGNRTIHRRVAQLNDATRDALPQSEETMARFRDDLYGTDDLCRYLNHSGCFPLYDRCQVRYFSQGEDFLPVFLEELEKAERFIYLEFFIIEEGYMWGRVLDVLSRKAAAGVDVRVMYDGMCEIFQLPYGYAKKLEELGIRARAFSPVTPFVSTHYNYRDHRKIAVIDGTTAFTGGVNLADEYINRVRRFGHWKDTAVMVRGDAARSFLLMFLQMWGIGEGEAELRLPEDLPETAYDEPGAVLPFGDCPLDAYRAGESVYMDLLYRANTYVHIMTPYLILDGEMETALTYAAQRGVDVKIILPGVPDKKMAYALAKSHYAALTEAGVRIYEYDPGFVHAKAVVSDDCRAVVGTINFDYRSFYHHFECGLYLYQTPCIPDIEADFQKTLAACRAVTPETIRQEKPFYRLAGGVLKLVAPLM